MSRAVVPSAGGDFPRSKAQHRAVWAATFRAAQVAQAALGTERLLALVLDASWVLRRYGLLLTGGTYGEDFYLTAHALTPELVLAAIPEGGHVLDVGSGFGRWTRVAAGKAGRVTAVDHDPGRVAAIASLGLAGVDAVLLDAEHGVGDLGPFDVAILSHVLEHLDDPRALLVELAACCRTLVIEVPDRDSDPLNYARLRLGRPYYTDGDHVREYTLELLSEQLAASGWALGPTRQRAGSLAAIARRTGD